VNSSPAGSARRVLLFGFGGRAEAPISPRRVVVFKPSAILKQQVNGKRSGAKTPVADLASSAPG
jgi:hypothetical protein